MASPQIKQCFIASGVFLNMLLAGVMISYPYSLLPGLKAPDSPIQVDVHTASSLASTVLLIIPIGIVSSSILIDWIGRKRTFIFMLLPNILGWTIIYLAQNSTTLMIGRIMGGIWLGSSHSLGCTILGEYTSPRYRGVFLAVKTIALCLGNLLLHIISQYCTWRTIALMNIIPPILIICSTYIWPESPAWLVTKRRLRKSEKAFYWLRGRNEKSVKEIEAMIQSQKVMQAGLENRTSFKEKVLCFLILFKTKKVLKPTFIMFFARFLSEATGRHVFPAYASIIIPEINSEAKTNKFMLTLTIDAITIVSSIICTFLIKYFRRRSLLFFSGCSSLLFLFSFCLYLFLVSLEAISSLRPWIPLTMLVVYYFLANLGCCSIPLILLGEVFPLNRKGAILTVAEVLSSSTLLIFLKVTPFMLVSLKVYGMFTVFGLCMVVSLLYLYFLLPETRNRTLKEIEDCFNDGKFVDVGKQNNYNDGDDVNDDNGGVKSDMLREKS